MGRAMRTILMTGALLWPALAMAQATAEPQQQRTPGSTAKNIMESPLKDLNIIKPKVPEKLKSIEARPYSLAGLKGCASYRAEIADLDQYLGPDVESPQAQARGNGASEFALGSVQDLAHGLIPGIGIIRRISGAEKEAKRAAAAYYAGALRRAYLKATARAHGCKIAIAAATAAPAPTPPPGSKPAEPNSQSTSPQSARSDDKRPD